MPQKILLVLLCIIAVNINANARQIITGSLTNKESTKPIEDANVELLLLPDSSTVEISKTNSEGLFIFYKADTVKTYCLRVRQVFYKAMSFPIVHKKNSLINNLGVITLEPATFNLKEIVVNGTKVSVTVLGDRTVYGIPEGIQKTSSDGLDVLRKIPSVQVDYLNEDITVNGKSNIVVEVDGVTRDKGYLKRLHPSQISKMEVVTSPGGKYDADVDAVINIITNPAMRYGLKGMVYAGAFPISSNSRMGMFNGSLDYGLEKISFYTAANYSPQHFDIGTDMNRIAGINSTEQNSTKLFKGGSANVNLGLIYDPDELNDINLNVSYNNSSNQTNNDAWNFNSSNYDLNSIFRTISNSKNNNDGLTSSIFYKHKFNKNTQHGLEAELNYYNSLHNNTNTNFQNIYFDPTDSTTELYSSLWQNEYVNTKVHTISGQTNYTLPFDSVYTFNVGLSGNYNKYTTDNTSTIIAEASNMDYSDLRMGAFAELSRNFKKGSVKVGSRFEASHVIINSANPHNYDSPLPYINGYYKFNGDNSIKLAYSRRVIRPTSGQLNPFVSVVDSQTISQGNPNLKPAYRDNFQLTYDSKLTIKKVTINLSPQLFYEYKTRLIQTILSQNSTTKLFESTPTNISNGYEAGGGLSINSQVGKVLFNSNFRYSFNHIDKYLDQIDPTNQQTWNWNSFFMFPLPLNMQFISILYISGPVLNGQTETKSSPFSMFGIGKQLNSSNTFRLFAFNPFASKFFNNTTTISNNSLYQKQNLYMNMGSGLMLMYIYNFKVGKSIDKQKHNVEQQVQDNLIKIPTF
jgi:outer membrane receptor protein involved in Fe transport